MAVMLSIFLGKLALLANYYISEILWKFLKYLSGETLWQGSRMKLITPLF